MSPDLSERCSLIIDLGERAAGGRAGGQVGGCSRPAQHGGAGSCPALAPSTEDSPLGRTEGADQPPLLAVSRVGTCPLLDVAAAADTKRPDLPRRSRLKVPARAVLAAGGKQLLETGTQERWGKICVQRQ